MQPRLLRDSRGNGSWTLTMIVPAFTALTLKFLAGGFTFPVVGLMPLMGGVEYATAAAALLGLWVTREYQDKKNMANGNGKIVPTLDAMVKGESGGITS